MWLRRWPVARSDLPGEGSLILSFTAKDVSCTEAIDYQIMQVMFDTVCEGGDEDTRDTPYVLIGQDFDFPGPATIEWHDGREYDGGARIRSVTLARDRVVIKLDRGLEMDVGFSVGKRKYAQLRDYLGRIVGPKVLTVR